MSGLWARLCKLVKAIALRNQTTAWRRIRIRASRKHKTRLSEIDIVPKIHKNKKEPKTDQKKMPKSSFIRYFSFTPCEKVAGKKKSLGFISTSAMHCSALTRSLWLDQHIAVIRSAHLPNDWVPIILFWKIIACRNFDKNYYLFDVYINTRSIRTLNTITQANNKTWHGITF